MDNQYKQISGRAVVSDSTKTADLLSSSTNLVIRLISVHVFVTTAASDSSGVVTLRDGTGGTILMQIPATAGTKEDMDFHDGLGYPMTAGNSLSLEVSGASSTQGTVLAIATGFLTGI